MIKHPQSPTSQRVVLTSFFVDLSDVILNIVVAAMSGSVTMLAQALQGASDLTASGFLLLGMKRAKRRANKKYNFGFGREIYFWSLISSVVMFTITGLIAIREGWDRIIHPQPIDNLSLALIILIVSLGTNGYAFWLSYQRLRANHPNSSLSQAFIDSHLIETKITFTLDLVGTAASVIGLVALALYKATGLQVYDGVGAIVIGVTVAIFAVFLIMECKDFLIGRAAQPEIEGAIVASALRTNGVKAVLDLQTMYIGSERLLVNMDIEAAPGLKTKEIERLAGEIKRIVKKEVPSVHHMQIELES
jgi:cation diffusion facilitator family transporter